MFQGDGKFRKIVVINLLSRYEEGERSNLHVDPMNWFLIDPSLIKIHNKTIKKSNFILAL